jgi:hypothetical protein
MDAALRHAHHDGIKIQCFRKSEGTWGRGAFFNQQVYPVVVCSGNEPYVIKRQCKNVKIGTRRCGIAASLRLNSSGTFPSDKPPE